MQAPHVPLAQGSDSVPSGFVAAMILKEAHGPSIALPHHEALLVKALEVEPDCTPRPTKVPPQFLARETRMVANGVEELLSPSALQDRRAGGAGKKEPNADDR